jgi:hypothetical protein
MQYAKTDPGAHPVPELHSASVYDPWSARGSQAFTQEDWNRSPFIVLIDL